MVVNSHTQQGAALFVALVFLVVITLVSIASMRSSTLELLMATNEQGQRIALDGVQSASTAVINSTELNPGGPAGEVTCFGFDYNPATTTVAAQVELVERIIDAQADCDKHHDLTAGSGYNTNTFVATTAQQAGNCPPSVQTSVKARGERSLLEQEGSSGSAANCRFFNLEGIHDAIAQKGGRAEILEGFIVGP